MNGATAGAPGGAVVFCSGLGWAADFASRAFTGWGGAIASINSFSFGRMMVGREFAGGTWLDDDFNVGPVVGAGWPGPLGASGPPAIADRATGETGGGKLLSLGAV